ncbi:hypothetical protein MTR67_032314 [Solanum verrucosum]|uniref:Uncharacterized protein n=1 Tax=Solanum verrucosum TaxID=315347 RepID=A0AAF0PUT3_SOLVR|nr:hypothetical protein MTR67_004562 [Solanum verrucosum]WMV38929.1 hypothetical protein MTR67_032314 [Solanum verrucosum]
MFCRAIYAKLLPVSMNSSKVSRVIVILLSLLYYKHTTRGPF